MHHYYVNVSLRIITILIIILDFFNNRFSKLTNIHIKMKQITILYLKSINIKIYIYTYVKRMLMQDNVFVNIIIKE